jgi:hypothetical protein
MYAHARLALRCVHTRHTNSTAGRCLTRVPCPALSRACATQDALSAKDAAQALLDDAAGKAEAASVALESALAEQAERVVSRKCVGVAPIMPSPRLATFACARPHADALLRTLTLTTQARPAR